MKTFISYDFDDKHKFDELAELFEEKGIEFFDPHSMRGNQSLASQLRESIMNCAACVFIATHNSVSSAWCAAELGAFWGAGKDVILYVADSSLKDEQLPKQFSGWLLVRNIFKVAKDIAALRDQGGQSASTAVPTQLGALSVDEFKALLTDWAGTLGYRSGLTEVIFQLAGAFDHDYDEDRLKRLAGRSLRSLLGETLSKAQEVKVEGWRYAFDAPTTTGTWIGYAQVSEQHADGMLQLYRKCLLLLLDEHRTIVGAALTATVTLAYHALGLSSWTHDENVLAHAGEVKLGVALPEDALPEDALPEDA